MISMCRSTHSFTLSAAVTTGDLLASISKLIHLERETETSTRQRYSAGPETSKTLEFSSRATRASSNQMIVRSLVHSLNS